MYLSLLLVDVGANPDRPRPGRGWIANPYRVHQRLCMAFPDIPHVGEGGAAHAARDERAGVLFRIEGDFPGQPRILVQSAEAPDWRKAFASALHLLRAEPQVKEFNPDPACGRRYRFFLRANVAAKRAVARKDGTAPANKRRFGLHREEEQRAWLARKGVEHGFVLEEARAPVARWRQARRSGDTAGNGQKHFGVDFTGILRVEDPVRFRRALISGIGPAKAFGFGLLSLARAEP